MGTTFLPESAIPYLGLLLLALGLKSAWQAWKRHGDRDENGAQGTTEDSGPRTLEVAAVTFANGGDNIGVHVPVFATAGPGGMSVYAVVFLSLVAAWCLAGRFSPPGRSPPRHSAGGGTSCSRWS